MFTFEHTLDLPLIWGGLIATAVFMYVLLDGFDLGLGILFPYAPTDKCRNKMMNSIAPFWDGNETWLVLGGGGLFAAFPLAYSIVMPALYLPIIFMLLGLIFRGVAFEFRFKAETSRTLWDRAFHFGSITASFFQGVILGALVQGIQVSGRSFSGGAFDWLTGFSILCGFAVVAGYALLGATWLIMKTDGVTQDWAKRKARGFMFWVGIFMVLVSLSVPFLNDNLRERWFSFPNYILLLPLPLITTFVFIYTWRSLRVGKEYMPFLCSLGLFLLAYLGLAISMWPWIVPYEVTLWEGAAAGTSLSILLIGAGIMLPVILAYTGYCYYLFRGKVSHETITY